MISIPLRKTKKRKGEKLDSAQHSEAKTLKTSETAMDNINTDADTRVKPETENSATETEKIIEEEEVRKHFFFAKLIPF